jgi:hypothetical protein
MDAEMTRMLNEMGLSMLIALLAAPLLMLIVAIIQECQRANDRRRNSKMKRGV